VGSVFKKAVTRPLPPGVEIILRQGVGLARWRNGKGKTRTAPLTTAKDGADRIRDESGTYVARYRDGNNRVVEFSTRCRDKSTAENVLADLKRKAERVRSGLLTPAEARTAEHLATAIGEHVAAYKTHLEAVGTSPKHRYETHRRLDRVLSECRFTALADLERGAVETWLVGEAKRAQKGMSARTRNTYLISLNAFAERCIETGRLTLNPFEMIARADERADRRRQRRWMTAAELVRLPHVAARAPPAAPLRGSDMHSKSCVKCMRRRSAHARATAPVQRRGLSSLCTGYAVAPLTSKSTSAQPEHIG
jgi:hypothetical protein